MGRPREAVVEYETAVSMKPALKGAQAGLAGALLDAGRVDEALARYDLLLRLWPAAAEIRRGMGDIGLLSVLIRP